MLAVMGQPFDSETHFFEYKWDGFRAAAMIEDRGVRLMSRNSLDLADQSFIFVVAVEHGSPQFAVFAK